MSESSTPNSPPNKSLTHVQAVSLWGGSGFVRYIQHMGSDRTVAEAAWVTSASRKRTDEGAARLIRNTLARYGHWTPFGHTAITLHMRIPIFVARQLMRSNVGIVYNEFSARYSDAIQEPLDGDSITFCEAYHRRRKRGRGEPLPPDRQVEARALYEDAIEGAFGAYRRLLDEYGVAHEQARMVLPVACMTELWMTGSLAAFARVYTLRAHEAAQQEIQDLARAMAAIIEPLFPVSWPALTEPARPAQPAQPAEPSQEASA